MSNTYPITKQVINKPYDRRSAPDTTPKSKSTPISLNPNTVYEPLTFTRGIWSVKRIEMVKRPRLMWRCRVRVARQDGLRPRTASNICSGVDVCNLSECQVGDPVWPNPVRYTSLCCLGEGVDFLLQFSGGTVSI